MSIGTELIFVCVFIRMLLLILMWLFMFRGLRRRKSGRHVGDDPVDAAFETVVGRVARDCDRRDDQHVLGHGLTFPALASFHEHSIQVSHYSFLTSCLCQHCLTYWVSTA